MDIVEVIMLKIQPMTLDEVEAYWPEVERMKSSGELTEEDYKEVVDYTWCY